MKRASIPVIALLAWLPLAPAVIASPLFEGGNANLWLVDPQGRQLTGYNAGGWLSQFAPGGSPVYPLDADEEALVNELGGSSMPLSAGQPYASLAGLGAAAGNTGHPAGQAPLRLNPEQGEFTDTVAVDLSVAVDLIEREQSVELAWQVNARTKQTMTVTEADLTGPQARIQDQYWVHRFHLVRDGDYTINAELSVNGSSVAQAQSSITLAASHTDGFRRDTDGDGVPDLVEAEIGLDPLTGDWRRDGDNDGWSDFDLWLRDGGGYSLNADGEPVDSDGDGWSDYDEDLRGTNPKDPDIGLPLKGNETKDSESYQQRLRRYLDFPAATRLYEVEHQVDGALAPVVLDDDLAWQAVRATRLHGAVLYDRADLVTEAELATTAVTVSDIAERRLADPAATRLDADQVPEMRLPAGAHTLLMAAQRFAGSENKQPYTQVYKTWLPRVADATPARLLSEQGVGDWTTVGEWKTAFEQYLRSQVVQPLALQLDRSSTVTLALLEAALTQEARLREKNVPQLFANPAHPVSRELLEALVDIWRGRFEDAYSWAQLHQQLVDRQGEGALLQALTENLTERFTKVEPGTRSDRRLIDPYLGADAHDALYRARLLFLPGADAALSDSTLHQTDADSDGDQVSNLAELDAPLDEVSLPWVGDTDGDGMTDGPDPCAVDPLNGCDGDSDLPRIAVAASIEVDEPGAGAGVALLTLTLDRAVDWPVSIDFETLAKDADTAVAGIDFEAIQGQVTVPPGSRVVVIPLPLLPDTDNDGGETFHLSLTSVTNATLVGDGEIEVTLNNTEQSPPEAKVANASLTVPERADVLLDASPSTDPAGFALTYQWSQQGGSDIGLNDADMARARFTAPEVLSLRTVSFEVVVGNEVALTDNSVVSVSIQPVDDAPEVTGTPSFNALQGQRLMIGTAEMLAAVEEPDEQPLSLDSIEQMPGGQLTRTDGGLTYYAPKGPRQLSKADSGDFLAVNDDYVVSVELGGTDPNRWVAYQPGTDNREVILDLGDSTGDGFLSVPGQDVAYFHDATARRLYQWRPGEDPVDTEFGLPFARSVVDPRKGDLYTCDANNTESWVRTDAQSLETTVLPGTCENTDRIMGAIQGDRFCIAQTSQMVCTDGNGGVVRIDDLSGDGQVQRLVEVGENLLVFVSNRSTMGDFDDYQALLLQSDDSVSTVLTVSSNASSAPAVQRMADGQVLMVIAKSGQPSAWRWSGQAGDTAEELTGIDAIALIKDHTGDLALHQGEVYWLYRVEDRQFLDRLDPETGALTAVADVGADADSPLRLVQAHRRLYLFAPAASNLDACDLMRMDNEAGLVTGLEDVACTGAVSMQENIVVHRPAGGAREIWAYDGKAFSGLTEFSVRISDDGGKSVELPAEIEVEAAP